jgi:nicotinamide-nucleotide amidase
MSTPAASGRVDEDTRRNRAEQVGELALARGRTIAVAESLTGGMIASALAQAQQASEWFRGSLVAYSTLVKHQLLEVPDGPVVSSDAAAAMARSARKLLLADVSVAVTGAGGPAAQDGHEPGTVFLAVDGGDREQVRCLNLSGEPAAICAAATLAALNALVSTLDQ